MSRPTACFALCLLFASTAWAQAGEAAARPPALLAPGKMGTRPLQVQRVSIEIQILGCIAETRQTLTFHNPQDRALAGDFCFPIPAGSTVSGYALDIDGRMVDGVAVRKAKARIAFDKEVRKGVDPGLVEWTQGNVFRTRVFPIPAKGTRTILIRTLSELDRAEGSLRYTLPLNFEEPVAHFSVKASVSLTSIKAGPAYEKHLSFSQADARAPLLAEFSEKNTAWTDDLVLFCPEVLTVMTFAEQDPEDGAVYYYILQEELPGFDTARPPVDETGPLLLYWDVSASHRGERVEQELTFLSRYLRDLTQRGQTLRLDLIPFHWRQEAARSFRLPEAHDRLLATLRALDCDGGTRLGALTVPAGLRPNRILLCTDGLATLGRERSPALAVPVLAFSASPAVNTHALHRLASASGGRFLHLARLSVDQALVEARNAATVLAYKASADSGELYPRPGTPVGERVLVAGRLVSAAATTIDLAIRRGGERFPLQRVRHTREAKNRAGILRTYWAQKKLNHLLAADAAPDIIAAHGKRFGLVTPETSLIVLETLEQYVEHEITPPRGLPEMRAEYGELMEKKEKAVAQGREDHLAWLVDAWQDRVAWWSREFKPTRVPKAATSLAGAEAAAALDVAVEEEPEEESVTLAAAASAVADEHDDDDGATTAPAVEPSERARPPRTPAPDGGGLFGDDDDDAEDAPTLRSSEIRRVVRAGISSGFRDGEGAAGADHYSSGDAGEAAPPAAVADTTLAAWDPQTPYLEALQRAHGAERVDVYRDQRVQCGASPAFFLDCANYFLDAGQRDLGVRVLTNLAELTPDAPPLLRVLAYRLMQAGELELAGAVLEEVQRLRPEEPQSWRDLARLRAAQGAGEAAAGLLLHVITGEWDRFEGIQLIALMELNRLLTKYRLDGEALGLDPRLVKLLDVDLRVVLSWDADLTDIDLWVTEPTGETCKYDANRTQAGGHMSHDFTQGYGPEEYFLRQAPRGAYEIRAHYYGSSAVDLTGAVTVQAEVFTQWGRPTEKRQTLTLRLQKEKDKFLVGAITIGAPQGP